MNVMIAQSVMDDKKLNKKQKNRKFPLDTLSDRRHDTSTNDVFLRKRDGLLQQLFNLWAFDKSSFKNVSKCVGAEKSDACEFTEYQK